MLLPLGLSADVWLRIQRHLSTPVCGGINRALYDTLRGYVVSYVIQQKADLPAVVAQLRSFGTRPRPTAVVCVCVWCVLFPPHPVVAADRCACRCC